MIGGMLVIPLLGQFMHVSTKTIVIGMIAMLVSFCYWQWNEARNVTCFDPKLQHHITVLDGYTSTLSGVCSSEVNVDGDVVSFQMKADTIHMCAKASTDLHIDHCKEMFMIQVKLSDQKQQVQALNWQRGDRVRLVGKIVPPGTARNFGGFDYSRHLHHQSIHWLVKVQGTQNMNVVAPEKWNMMHLFRWNDVARRYVTRLIERLYAEPHAGYMKGLLIGVSKEMERSTYAQFTQLGLSHILAISGTHVGVFVFSLLRFFSFLRMSRESSLLVVIIFLPAYMLLSGSSPSVIRAGTMSIIGLYAALKNIRKDTYSTMSMTALCMLLWNPYFLLNVSFQLSFLVTLGLLVYMPFVSQLFVSWHPTIRNLCAVTLTAQLVSFPVTVYYFNQFCLLSIVANFLLVSLIAFIVLPLGAVSLGVGCIWPAGAKPLVWFVTTVNEYIFVVMQWLNTFDQTMMIWATPSFFWMLAFYGILFIGLRLFFSPTCIATNTMISEQKDNTVPLVYEKIQQNKNISGHHTAVHIAWPELTTFSLPVGAGGIADLIQRQRKRVMGPILLLLFLVLLWWGYQTPYDDERGMVSFLDIGQGDSTLITTPAGKNILVDGGGTVRFGKSAEGWKKRRDSYEVGQKVVVPLLQKRGIHHLDAVILTHGDQDHGGGLDAVLDHIPTRMFLYNGTVTGKPHIDRLMHKVIQKKIPLYGINDGIKWCIDDKTTATFLNPPSSSTKAQEKSKIPLVEDQNHESIVFQLDMDGASFLFTGDMDEAAEQTILCNRVEDQKKLDNAQETKVQSKYIDVLKVSHHGSNTASMQRWLYFWQPRAAVVSVGATNVYRHPHPAVISRLQRVHAKIFRTDRRGEIQMKVRKGKITVRTQLSEA